MKNSINPLFRVTMLSLVLIFGLSCGLASARDEVCFYDQRDYRGDRFCTSEPRKMKTEVLARGGGGEGATTGGGGRRRRRGGGGNGETRKVGRQMASVK